MPHTWRDNLNSTTTIQEWSISDFQFFFRSCTLQSQFKPVRGEGILRPSVSSNFYAPQGQYYFLSVLNICFEYLHPDFAVPIFHKTQFFRNTRLDTQKDKKTKQKQKEQKQNNSDTAI